MIKYNFYTLVSIVTIVFISHASSAQIVLLDTVRVVNNNVDISWGEFYGNELYAWYEADRIGNLDVLNSYQGVIDTLVGDPPYDSCDSKRGLYVAGEHIVWGTIDATDSDCFRSFTWKDGIVTADEFGVFYVQAHHKEQLAIQYNGSAILNILDLSTETITPLTLGTTTHLYYPSNIITLSENTIWIKGFKRTLNSAEVIGQSIIKYDRLTGTTTEIYFSSSNFLFFKTSGSENEDQIAFIESLPDNSQNLYYFDGTSVQFVVNGPRNIQAVVFNNSVIYSLGGGDPAAYILKPGAPIAVYHPNAPINDAFNSRCFLYYRSYDSSNYPNVSTKIYITNGIETDSLVFPGIVNNFRFEENNILFSYKDLVTETSYLIRARHNLGCTDSCPDDNAFADSWNTEDFLSTKTILSITEIPSQASVLYEASDYISLSESFEVKLGAVFLAKIVGCP